MKNLPMKTILILLFFAACSPTRPQGPGWIKLTSNNDSITFSDLNVPYILRVADSIHKVEFRAMIDLKNHQLDSVRNLLNKCNINLDEMFTEYSRRENDILEAKNKQIDSMNVIIKAQEMEIATLKNK